MNKQDVLDHLKEKWWQYLLLCFVSIFAVTSVYTVVAQPTRQEKLVYFVGNYSDTYRLDGYLQSITPEGIAQIEVRLAAPEDRYFSTVLSSSVVFFAGTAASGSVLADVLILPESVLKDMDVQVFASGGETVWKDLFGDQTYYSVDGAIYGIRVFDKNEADDSAVLTYTLQGKEPENYYLLFGADSVHLGALNHSRSDAAITVVKEILAQ